MDFRARYGPWALVTGASSGLGEEYARQLARRGLNLLLLARRAERLDRLAEELRREFRIDAKTLPCDLADPVALRSAIAAASAHEVGLLVNNAGFGWSGSMLEQDEASISRMVRVNCEAPVLLARAMLPAMARRGRGGMLVVASVAGHLSTPWMSLYGGTKAFDLHWGEGVAVEMRSQGVDVLVSSPGHTRTEFHGAAGVDQSATGGSSSPVDVVRTALDALGKREHRSHGALNRILITLPRLVTRRLLATAAGSLLGRRLRRSQTQRSP